MRRTLGVLLAIALVAVAGLVAIDPRPAGAQQGSLTLFERGTYVYLPFDANDPSAERVPVMVVEPGKRYRFQVDYTVEGADAIVTGNTFDIEEAVSGRTVRNSNMTFDPQPPGRYNESTTFDVPEDWDPGVYLFKYRVFAEAPRFETTTIDGEASFLVSPGS